MSLKLKFALICRRSDRGFALPIAIGLGFVFLLIAATLVMRSQGDQVTASAQKATSQGLSVTETGVTRVQAFLAKYPGFADKSYPWTTHLSNLITPCTSGTIYDAAADFNDWKTVGSGTDRFKVISYTPSGTDGILVVEGQARDGSNATSSTRLQARIPLNKDAIPSFPPPAAWAQNFGLGNNRITGNVIDASCSGSISADEDAQISGDVLRDPTLTLPPPLSVPAGAINLSAITSGTTILPRNTDTANADGVYVYRVAANAGKSIDLTGNPDKLIIKPGQKVSLYLDGNVRTQGGQVKIGHNCYDTDVTPDGEANAGATKITGCEPTNFQIFGGQNTTSILLGGSNTVDAFIFAPHAIDSGVNGSAQIRGSVWLKEWDAANGNHTVIEQTAAWNNIPTLLRPAKIAPISSWERQEIP
ncbi:hypothetical protein IQ272_18465 [Chroococcidiopsidales cyanobacterium LEGE 13417]|nr:hypothetical protein [Chroococcidiopsidales cyanobacterium LEGE 13417]